MPLALMNVRFEGNNGHDATVTRCPLMTQSGHAACPPLVLSSSFTFCSVALLRRENTLGSSSPCGSTRQNVRSGSLKSPLKLSAQGRCNAVPTTYPLSLYRVANTTAYRVANATARVHDV